MQLLYVDESGDLGPLPASPSVHGNDQPVFVLGALIVDSTRLDAVTQDFLHLKSRWFPGLPYPSANHLDKIIPEIKGADLRRNAARGNRNQRRQVIGFLDHLLRILEFRGIRLLARIWVKGLGQPFAGRSVYTSSIQGLYTYFDQYLSHRHDYGFCIADSRDHLKNEECKRSTFHIHAEVSNVVDRLFTHPGTANVRSQREPCRHSDM